MYTDSPGMTQSVLLFEFHINTDTILFTISLLFDRVSVPTDMINRDYTLCFDNHDSSRDTKKVFMMIDIINAHSINTPEYAQLNKLDLMNVRVIYLCLYHMDFYLFYCCSRCLSSLCSSIRWSPYCKTEYILNSSLIGYHI